MPIIKVAHHPYQFDLVGFIISIYNEQPSMSNFKEFLDYCESFYLPSHPDVLYPIDGLTREELALATLNYLDLCEDFFNNGVTWGGGDSVDRERVRDLVIERKATKPQLPVLQGVAQ